MAFIESIKKNFIKYIWIIFGFFIIYAKGYLDFKFDAVSLILYVFIVLITLIHFDEVLDLLHKHVESGMIGKEGISFKLRGISERIDAITAKTPDIKPIRDSFWSSLEHNSNLYIAYGRIEIEKRIDELFNLQKKNNHPIPLHARIRILFNEGILPMELYTLLRDILPICNMGIHGKPLSHECLEWGTNVLPKIISILDSLIEKYKNDSEVKSN